MRTVIRSGRNIVRTTECKKCGCIFTYTKIDTMHSSLVKEGHVFVECPECGAKNEEKEIKR